MRDIVSCVEFSYFSIERKTYLDKSRAHQRRFSKFGCLTDPDRLSLDPTKLETILERQIYTLPEIKIMKVIV